METAASMLGGTGTLVVLMLAGIMLAGLDLAGSFFAAEWSNDRRPSMWLLGAAAFLVLYVVYATSLKYAELTTVSLTWMVLIQVGVMLLDHFRYGNHISVDKWVAVAAILVLMTYVLAAPGSDRRPPKLTSKQSVTQGPEATVERSI